MHTNTHTTAYLAPCYGLNVFPEFICSALTTNEMVPQCGVFQVGREELDWDDGALKTGVSGFIRHFSPPTCEDSV